VSYQKDVLGQPLSIAIDAAMPNDNDTTVGGGVEYWVKDTIAIRTGYKTGMDIGSGLRAGIGLKTAGFVLDYAFAGFGELGNTHRVGASIRFGEGYRTNRVEQLLDKADKEIEEASYTLAMSDLNKVLTIQPENKKALELMRTCYAQLNQAAK
jgi:hypothetical protein